MVACRMAKVSRAEKLKTYANVLDKDDLTAVVQDEPKATEA